MGRPGGATSGTTTAFGLAALARTRATLCSGRGSITGVPDPWPEYAPAAPSAPCEGKCPAPTGGEKHPPREGEDECPTPEEYGEAAEAPPLKVDGGSWVGWAPWAF